MYYNTCIDVRLLGPCFKTGSREPLEFVNSVFTSGHGEYNARESTGRIPYPLARHSATAAVALSDVVLSTHFLPKHLG